MILYVFLTGLACALYLTRKYVFGEWFQAEAEEILLVVKGGKILCSGVGLSYLTRPFSGKQVIRITTTLQVVRFEAKLITPEKQGVKVSGFVLWKIKENAEDALNCYKTLGLKNLTVEKRISREDARRAMTVRQYKAAQFLIEKIVAKICNAHNISFLLEDPRSLQKNLMDAIVEKWGAWGAHVDSVEIDNVRVSSDKVFQNMQVGFRENLRLESETTKAETEGKLQLDKERRAINLMVAKTRLKQDREVKEAQLIEVQDEIAKKRLDQRKRNEIAEWDKEIEMLGFREKLERTKLETRLLLSKLAAESRIAEKRLEVEFEERKSDEMFRREMMQYATDKAFEAFKGLKVGDVTNYNVGHGMDAIGMVKSFVDQFGGLSKRVVEATKEGKAAAVSPRSDDDFD